MQAEPGSGFDWRDGAAYAPLLGADRSLFAWEWLRREPHYRFAAERALGGGEASREQAAAFGLVTFEPPEFGGPQARPLWRSDIHPQVLAVERGSGAPEDSFRLDSLRQFATLHQVSDTEHLLLSDGLRAIRLDAPRGTFGPEPICLRYRLEGLATAGPLVLTLRRFLALCRSGHFARSLHSREPRARRWILTLRAWDGLAGGADQREIAEVLLSGSAAEPRWRNREPSLRSQAQRLVRSARWFAAGGYRTLLR
jgi:hypothetical protein